MSYRARVVSAVAGFRGAVSLAVPTTLSGRAEIIFVATGVVILTLVVQGFLLPPVVRWARFPPDNSFDEELAQTDDAATTAALQALPDVTTQLQISEPVRERVTAEYRRHLDETDAARRGNATAVDAEADEYVTLRLAPLEHKRDVMIRLSDDRAISDPTLRTAQARLDREALRLSQPDVLE